MRAYGGICAKSGSVCKYSNTACVTCSYSYVSVRESYEAVVLVAGHGLEDLVERNLGVAAKTTDSKT